MGIGQNWESHFFKITIFPKHRLRPMVPQVLSFDTYLYICKLNIISSLSITSVYLQVTAEAKLQVSDDDGHEMMARRSIILCDCIASFLNFETYRTAEGTLPSAASQFSLISYQPCGPNLYNPKSTMQTSMGSANSSQNTQ